MANFADVAGRSLVFHQRPQVVPVRRRRATISAVHVVRRHPKMREGLALFIRGKCDRGNDRLDEAVRDGGGSAGNLEWGTLFHIYQSERDNCWASRHYHTRSNSFQSVV